MRERTRRLCGGAVERLCFGAAFRSRRELHSTKSSPVPRDVAPRAESSPRRFDRLRRLPWLPLLIVALLVAERAVRHRPDPRRRDGRRDRRSDAASLRRLPAPRADLGRARHDHAAEPPPARRAHPHAGARLGALVVVDAVARWISPFRRRVARVRLAARVGIALAVLAGVYAVGAPRPATDGRARDRGAEHPRRSTSTRTRSTRTTAAGTGTPRTCAPGIARPASTSRTSADHRTFEGAREGWANNPAQCRARRRVLLPAIEAVWKGEHVNVLDADRMYRGILDAALARRRHRRAAAREPGGRRTSRC